MSIEKLTILHEEKQKDVYSGTIEALFNPTELSFSKSVTWATEKIVDSKMRSQSWKTRYASSSPETLSVSLFFDVYEEAGQLKGSLWSLILSSPSVFEQTQKIAALARCQSDLHRPPYCKLQWGKRTLFLGVVTSVKQRVTLFLDDGTPVRATVDCSFREVTSDSDAVRDELYSPDVDKTYVVRPGDTLNRIASEFYENPSLWRVIAEANRIDNPRRLSPGQVLLIPKIV